MLKQLLSISSVCLVLGLARVAHAYPEFIGYGYTSCATCHYNTQGNGPLNDYGRALFAGEIAARDAFDDSTTDEELGAASGFLGKKELPWWLRPSAKFRNLMVQVDPGSKATKDTWRYIMMQTDVNLTLIFDRDQKFLFNGNLGMVYRRGESPVYRTETWLSREHYLRWQASKSLFISVGMLDKVFGIRLIDHTAFSRGKLGLNQYNDTVGTLTHGVVTQWNTPEREITLHTYIGNMNEDEKTRTKGASLMYEFSQGEKTRPGVSVLYQYNDANIKKLAVAVHDKIGLSHGSALLAELGHHRDEDTDRSVKTAGYYAYAQSTVLIRRGYNFYSLAEFYKSSTSQPTGDIESPDQFRWGLGILAFPLPRTEVRVTAQDARLLAPDAGTKDNWSLQMQFHLSL